MYCQSCGKEIDKEAVICVHCGVPTNNYNGQVNKKSGKGRGIAGMILGIIGILYCLIAFSSLGTFEFKINMAAYTDSERFPFAIGFVLVQSIFAILAVSLSGSERKKFKNGFNTSGLWLGLVSFAMIAIQFIYVITY